MLEGFWIPGVKALTQGTAAINGTALTIIWSTFVFHIVLSVYSLFSNRRPAPRGILPKNIDMHRHFLIIFLALLLFSNLNAQQQNISNGIVFEGEPFIAVNPSNPQNIVVAWMGFVLGNNQRLSIKVRSSFDGGTTWKPIVVMPHIVAAYKSADPSMVFDQNGNLFLSYIDYQESPSGGGVYLFKSTPMRVNDDSQANGKMQDLVWGDFDDDGALVISWRDRRNAIGTGYATASEFYAAYRPKNSPNFNANFRLSDIPVAYNNILAQSGNDFMGIELSRDTISAVWANTRDGSLDVWFVRVAALSGQMSAISMLAGESEALNIYPLPSSGVFNVTLTTQEAISALYVYDAQGNEILRTFPDAPNVAIDLTKFPTGYYPIRIESKGLVYSRLLLR